MDIRRFSLCFLSLALATASVPAAQAQVPEWRPIAAAAKSATAPATALERTFAGLPPGSVTRLQPVSAKAAGGWTLHLPDGSRFAVEQVARSVHPNGDVTYAGTLQRAGALYGALLTVGRDASFGSWRTPAGSFRFESHGAEGWLVETQHPGLQLQPADTRVGTAGGAARTAPAAAAAAPAAAKAGETVIDVAFLYDAGFAARYPGGAAQTRINHLVAIANQGFADSGLALVLRLVGSSPTAYAPMSGDNGIALEALAASVRGDSFAFPEALGFRESHGADLVTFVWPHDIETRGSCGMGFIFGEGAGYGANVLSDGFDSWSLCSDDTYMHEVGHNLGAEHQDGANTSEAGFGTPFILSGRLHTVMGSFGSGHPDRYLALPRFSNPAQRCGGVPCGLAGVHDNARRIRDNMAAVAAYSAARSSAAVTAPPMRDPDADSDGATDSTDAFPHDPRWQADRDGDAVADSVDAFPDQAAEWADTDGDGSGDNADADDDGDGVADAADAFARDASEQADSDGDGVGDHADAFVHDALESRDSDGDGIGDRAETDADGDGAADLATGSTAATADLLVVSAGTDRVLRFDGDSGLYAGVEIAAAHTPVALGSQTDLAWDPQRKLLLALVAGGVGRYERHGPAPLDSFVFAHPAAGEPALLSSFPAGLAVAADGTVVVADDTARTLSRHDPVRGTPWPGGVFFAQPVFESSPRDALSADGATVWTLERSGRVLQVDIATGALLREGTPPVGSFRRAANASALAMAPDGSALFIADLAGDHVLRVPVAALDSGQTFVAGGSGGLDDPTGLAFGPDGHLYVSSSGTDQVLRFDGASGAFIDAFARAPAGRLQQPRDLLFVPRVEDRYPRNAERRVRPVAGGWYNPARSGHGLDLQLIGEQLSVIWYTFRNDGTPTWYLATGPLRDGRWNGELQQFHWDGDSAAGTPIGTATLEFDGERNAVFAWALPGSSGSEPMQPLALGTSSETQFPTAAWYPPAQSGWGLSVTRQGEVTYAIAFLYDQAGEPSWLIGHATASTDSVEMAMERAEGSTRCPGCSGSTGLTSTPAGQLLFTVIDAQHARVDTGFAAGGIDWQRSGIAFQRLTDTPTQASDDPLH